MSGKVSTVAVRGMVMELAILCPADDSFETCPLYEIRKLPLDNKLGWVMVQSDEDILNIYSAHRECLEAKSSLLASS